MANQFERELRQAEQKHNAGVESLRSNQEFLQYLADISGVGEGSDPAIYLGKRRAKIAHDFVDVAAERDWPNALDLTLQVPNAINSLRRFWRGGDAIWNNPGQYSPTKAEQTVNLKTDWEGKGYAIGKLALAREQPTVVLCDDGMLRCQRTPYAFPKSYGYGYGALPNPKEVTKLFRDQIRVKVSAQDGDDPKVFAGMLAKNLLPNPDEHISGYL